MFKGLDLNLFIIKGKNNPVYSVTGAFLRYYSLQCLNKKCLHRLTFVSVATN